ncbi:MAG TPA: glycosyltransferase family 4 protein [Chitinophagaceae bacterium]|nr:glycosyltransferase family 4 protein [Chitinophagaceae bacterium]HNE92865.1 glycosyltransferase family 4 protein [Chitinophagaceae bacterium]HNF30323.1 glycosyltransferase family 4 protein [Chitinophagaceae bacterium]HNN31902.1 glycosyltransferase family 4 protein [Chitinophagaceae bacterium]
MYSILFISLMNSDPWGGSEVQWYATANYAIDRGDKVTCMVYEWDAKKEKMELLKKRGATIIYIPNFGRAKRNLYERLSFEWVTRGKQRRFINNFIFSSFDFAVVNQGGFMEVANNPWKNLYKKLPPYIVTFHNYTLNYSFKPAKAKTLTAWMLNAKCLIFAAAKAISELEKQLNNSFKNVLTLASPLSIEKSLNYTPYPSLKNGKYKVIMLAHLDVNRKAQDNLIKAFANDVWKKRNVILEIYGGGEHFNMLQELITKLNLQEIVFLKGNTNNVAEVLNTAHLVLQITHKDAMPISVIEAMSKSRAVVVSNVGDMPVWIKDNETGWVTPDASIQSIEQGLETAWQNKTQWEQMGKNAFDFFNKNFPSSVEEVFYTTLIKK